MGSLVVVAIPHEDDKVWKVSSEKVPHLTLLYLGDSSAATNVDSITEFLDHAASTSLDRFGLDVDRRGTLGEDQADVLFFEKGWEAKEVKRFRHFLLQNNDIRRLYDSSEQYPDWQPHLTLGYPATPAKPNPDDHGIGWVRFDRIALWLGDYEGPEFTLRKHNSITDVSMSDTIDNILAHYGKKGMRWGVRSAKVQRQDLAGAGKTASARKVARLDKKFEKSVNLNTYIKIHNGAAEKANAIDIDRINNKPEYKKAAERGDLLDGSKPITQKYAKEHQDAFVKRVRESAEALGTNASGTRKYSVRSDADGNWSFFIDDVKHSDTPNILIRVIKDAKGQIIKLIPEETTMAQTTELIDTVLIHYGKKGMRWGVRTSDSSGAAQKSAIPRRKGSSTQILSTDAKKAANAQAKAKTKGTKSLTNNELRVLNDRLRLEQQLNQLNPHVVKVGHDRVREILALAVTVNTAVRLAQSPAAKAAAKAVKSKF